MTTRGRRRRPRQERSKATVEAILEAVTRILKADGASAVTTNRVATVAGVSVGTLYQYFSSKEAIFHALHEREFQRLVVRMRAALSATEGANLEVLTDAVIDAIVEARLADPELHRLLAHTVPRQTDTQADLERMATGFTAAIAARRAELRADVDLNLFTYTLGNLISGVTSVAALSWRPPGVSIADARADALRGIHTYIDRHRA